MKIYTIGYENGEIDDFVSFLKKKKIRQLADLRKNPVSRKKGFSKNKLAQKLAEQNIEYFPFPQLGMPREWRQAAKEKRITRQKMFSEYAKKILPRERAELERLLKVASSQNTALLCFEKDPMDCHRSFAADGLTRLSSKKIQVVHLFLPETRIRSLFRGRV